MKYKALIIFVVEVLFFVCLTAVLLVIGVGIWIVLAIVISLLVITLFIEAQFEDALETNKWHKRSHIPKWVTKEAKRLSREYSNLHASEEDRVVILNGTRFVYKMTFNKENGQLMDVYRKRKMVKKQGAQSELP